MHSGDDGGGGDGGGGAYWASNLTRPVGFGGQGSRDHPSEARAGGKGWGLVESMPSLCRLAGGVRRAPGVF